MSKRPRRQRPQPLQVILTVSGGLAELLFKSKGVAVALYDYDVEGSDQDDPGISKDHDGQLCRISRCHECEQIVSHEEWPVVKKALQARYSRLWKCPDCGRTIECSYEDLAHTGTPLCTDCNTEMDMP